jgi:hypothetical protein
MTKTERKGRPLGWDITLALLTAITLMAFGVLCLYGMFYYKFQSGAENWSVVGYQQMMNRLAVPLTVLTILWLALCVPKRLFPRRLLVRYSIGIMAATLVFTFTWGLIPALGVALVLSTLLQVVVLGLIFTKVRLRFSRRGLATKLGSCLIHLGFLLFVIDLALLQGSPWHLPLFWVSTVLMTAGCLVSFYLPGLGPKRRKDAPEPAAAQEFSGTTRQQNVL